MLTQDAKLASLEGLEQRLQAALQSFDIQVQIRSLPHDHLDVGLIRSQQTKVNYPNLARQVQTTLRTLIHQQITTITLYGQVEGQPEPEWTMTSRLDEDDLINQVLKHDLALLQIKTLVRRKQDHLHILLTRPAETSVNYPAVMRLIRDDLRMLRPSEVTGITVYGREQDQRDYEWQVTSRLQEDSEGDRDGTTLHMPIRKPSQPPTPITVLSRSRISTSRWIGPLIGLAVFLLVGLVSLVLIG